MIIGLDLSTNTGWSVFCPETGDLLDCGEHKFLEKGVDRLLEVDRWLEHFYDSYPPTMVVMENYGFGNKFTLVPLVEIGTIARLVTANHETNFSFIAPTALKKFVTGRGNAPKDHMMLEVFKRWNFSPKTNNEADAYALGMIGCALTGIFDARLKHQTEVLAKLTILPSV